MNHRSRPDIPPQWRSSTRLLSLQTKSQSPVLPVTHDPRLSLSSPPESPPPTSPFAKFAGKGPVRPRGKQPPATELREVEDEEYAPKPYNPYNLPPASVIAVEVGSQSQSLSRVSPPRDFDNQVIPENEDSDVAESRAITISTFFSPDLDAKLPRTPDSDDNVGKRGRPVVQKRIASRGGGGAIRSIPRTTRVSPMTTPTKSRFSRDTRDGESNETSFACPGAKAVTNTSKRRNLASLLGIKTKGAKSASKAGPMKNEDMMDLDVDGGLDLDLKKLKSSVWGDVAGDAESWDEGFFAAGGGREDRGSGEGDNGQWTDYLQTVGDTMTIASMDFVMPRAAPLPPNPSLPTIPTLPSLSQHPLDDATQDASVVTSTPRTKERAKKSLKRTGRIISTGFPSPVGINVVPTTTFGLGLEGMEMELAMAMDTNFMDIDNRLDADGDVHMDQMTDVTPTMTTKTTITNGKTKDKNQNLLTTAMDTQRQQQPTPAESTVRLPHTSLALKTPFGGSARRTYPTTSNNITGTTTKPLPLPHNRQLLLTRSLSPRTPLSGSKPPAQKLMGKTMLSLPSVSTTVVTPRPGHWNETSPATLAQRPLSPLSPSPTPSPEQTPCPPERPAFVKRPTQPAYKVDKPLPVPNVARKGGERVERAVPMTKTTSVNGKKAGAMDEVQMCARIDECIAATDRMEEVSMLLPPALICTLTRSRCRLCALVVISTRHRLRLSATC